MSLTAALSAFVQLRNLEAHHAGRHQQWVDGHPDYPRLFAPLLAEAAWDLFTNSALTAPLHGWCLAIVTDISRPTRGGAVMTTLEPDSRTIQRAYAEAPPANLAIGDQVIIDLGKDPTRARIVMPFLDVSHGVPNKLLAEREGSTT